MYEPSRNLMSFYIAGVKHHEGALVLGEIKVGDALDLVAEPDNPYDPCAVAIKRGEVRLGYVPKTCNAELSLLMYYGHGDIFECRAIQVSLDSDPWEQLRVAIYVRDAR